MCVDRDLVNLGFQQRGCVACKEGGLPAGRVGCLQGGRVACKEDAWLRRGWVGLQGG